MRVNPISLNQVNFQRNEKNSERQSSPLKNAAKAIIVVPFIMPVAITSCGPDDIDIDINREHEIHATDSVTHDSHHDHYESKTANFDDNTLDILG